MLKKYSLFMVFTLLWWVGLSLPQAAVAAKANVAKSVHKSVKSLEVLAIRFGVHEDKRRAVIELSDPAAFQSFVMSSPSRIVIDISKFSWGHIAIGKDKTALIRDVRLGEIAKDKSRIVIETAQDVAILSSFSIPAKGADPFKIVADFRVVSGAEHQNTVKISAALPPQTLGSPPQTLGTITIPGRKPSFPDLPVPGNRPNPAQSSTQGSTQSPALSFTDNPRQNASQNLKESPKQEAKIRLEKPLIIIDPGHGGQDPGAIGANGMYEKTIVLAVGLELKRQLEASGRYRVKMTRDSDVFIPLGGRVKYARRQKGDLFISLHADSIRNANVTGASVYTLSDTASDKETAKLAERENKSDLIAGVDLSNQEEDVAGILIDLAARDTMNQSRFLARTVLNTFDANGVKVIDKSQKSAGFAVLKAMDIPSVLIEMGYLTNMNEVQKLSSPRHRQLIAANIMRSVDYFFQKTSP